LRRHPIVASWQIHHTTTSAGGGSDGNFTAAIAPTLDGLGVDGDGGHTLEERLYIDSIIPRTQLLMRLMETLG
jgi:glutamate carboxypeptidase